MNRIPAIVAIVFIIYLILYFIPKIFPRAKKKTAAVFMTFYSMGILYLTLLARLVNFREIYMTIFNMHAISDIYAAPEVGNRGSEWSAEQMGIKGLELLKYSLSDPNSPFYLIPSCLMNLFLLLPYGMMYRCVASHTKGEYKRQCIVCAWGILVIEILQFVFHLGQFDLLDVLFNTLGFYLGMKVWDRFLAKEWK